MILGPRIPGGLTTTLPDGEVRVSALQGQRQRLACLTAYLDGLGATNAPQVLRGVIYDADDALLARSDEVTIGDEQEEGWIVFPFSEAEGLELPPEELSVGLLSGPTGGNARIFRDNTAAGHRSAADPYLEGPSPALPATANQAGILSVFLTVFDGWEPPPGTVEDDHYARMPFELSQRILAATAPLGGSGRTARVGFHGGLTDPEEGAFCIVRSDGPLADLVGERLRISHRQGNVEREVFVLVHDEQEWPEDITDEDASITRRAWLELAIWPSDALDVVVETMS